MTAETRTPDAPVDGSPRDGRAVVDASPEAGWRSASVERDANADRPVGSGPVPGGRRPRRGLTSIRRGNGRVRRARTDAVRAESVGLLTPPFRAITVGMIALASLVAFEYLAVTTAMPTVVEALDGLALYPLAFGGALAAGVVGMVVSGSWSDTRGPAGPLWGGVAWFVAGLLLAGLAPAMWAVVVGRVVQGFGGGLLSVALYVVVARVYPAELRPRIFAGYAAAWVLPSIVGPAIAGLIVEQVGWRWVFLGVPILAVPAALLLRPGLAGLGAPPRDEDASDPVPAPTRRVPWALGAAASALLLHYGGQQRGPSAVVLLGVALAGLAVFAPRLLPAGTLRVRRGLPAVVALRGIAGAAFVGAEVYVPLMLSRERGLSPAAAGLTLTAAALGWGTGSWYRGRPNQRYSPTRILQAGMALIAYGIAAVALLVAPAVPTALGVVGWAVAGLGMGVVFPTLSLLTLELSPPAEQGTNSSALQLGDSLFTASVLALGGALFTALLSRSSTAAFLAGYAVAGGLALLGLAMASRTREEPSD